MGLTDRITMADERKELLFNRLALWLTRIAVAATLTVGMYSFYSSFSPLFEFFTTLMMPVGAYFAWHNYRAMTRA